MKLFTLICGIWTMASPASSSSDGDATDSDVDGRDKANVRESTNAILSPKSSSPTRDGRVDIPTAAPRSRSSSSSSSFSSSSSMFADFPAKDRRFTKVKERRTTPSPPGRESLLKEGDISVLRRKRKVDGGGETLFQVQMQADVMRKM